MRSSTEPRRHLVPALAVEELHVDHRGIVVGDLPLQRVHAQLDRAVQLARIVGPMEEVLGHHGRFGHLGGAGHGLGHVAVLALHALGVVGAGLPLEVGGLDPHAVGTHLVVAGAAEVSRLQEVVLDRVVVGRDHARLRPLLEAAGFADPVEVVGSVALVAGDGVAEVAAHGLVGPAALCGPRRRHVAGQERDGGVAPVAAGLDARNDRVLLRVAHRELEVLDLVPVVGVGLAHHGLGPLLVDVVVAAGADDRLLVVVVAARAEGGVTRGARGRDGQQQRCKDGWDHGALSLGVLVGSPPPATLRPQVSTGQEIKGL